MKFKIIITIMALTILASAGDIGKIEGTVVEKETGELLPGVNVAILNTYFGASTDVDGYFVILNVPAGIYTVTANFVGYKEARIDSVVVEANLTTSLNIEMDTTAIDMYDKIDGIEPLKEVVSKPDLNVNAEELKHTIITPHLEQEITSGTNVLWCNTFQLA